MRYKLLFFSILSLMLNFYPTVDCVVNAEGETISTVVLDQLNSNFNDDDVIEYGYFGSFCDDYDTTAVLNTSVPSFSANCYYPHISSVNVPIEKQLNDELFSAMWDDSSFDGLDFSYVDFGSYDSADEYEKSLRNFDEVDVDDIYNYEYLNMEPGMGVITSLEPKIYNSGIMHLSDDEEYTTFQKVGFSSIGGYSLISSDIYLNTKFDSTLKKNNNLDIALISSLHTDYKIDTSWLYNAFTIINQYVKKGSFYKIPLIKVDDDVLGYVVLTGEEVGPLFVSLNSMFRFSTNYNDFFGFFLSLPYYSFIEKITFTLPFFIGSFQQDLTSEFTYHGEEGYVALNYYRDGITPYYIHDFYTSFVPYWFNNEGIFTARAQVLYCPVKVISLSAENNTIQIKHFANEYYANNLFEPVSISMVSDKANEGDVSDYQLKLVDADMAMLELGRNREEYITLTYSLSPALHVMSSSGKLNVTSLYYRYYANDNFYIEDNLEDNQYFNYYYNRTAQRVYMKYEIRNYYFNARNVVNFNFYLDEELLNKITGIDFISFNVRYGNGDEYTYIIKSTDIPEYNFIDGYYYVLPVMCSDSKYNGDQFYINCDEHFFDESSGFAKFLNKTKKFDFTYVHWMTSIFGIGYKDCAVNSIKNAYCNFWVDSNTYVKGGTGESALHVEYDSDGKLLGVYNGDGSLNEDFIVDEDNNIVDKETGETFVDDSIVSDRTDFFVDIKDSTSSFLDKTKELFETIKFVGSFVIVGLLICICIYVISILIKFLKNVFTK